MIFVCLITATGCATYSSPTMAPPSSTFHSFSLPPTTPATPNGIYHTVQKGETLWRIARVYQIPTEEIVKMNRLPDATKLKTGQRIFIPGASQALEIQEEATAYGAVMASFTVEDFGVRRLLNLTSKQIQKRFIELQRVIRL